jgi:phenylacetate-CoA ligase
MSLYQKLYGFLPVGLQNLAVSGYGYFWKKRRFGGVFLQKVKEFKDRNFFSYDQWIDYQEKELRKLLVHAFSFVPYYNKIYSQCGIRLNDLQNFRIEQLKYLPIIEKETLRKIGGTELLSTKRSSGRKFFSSSGSTGTPVRILYSKYMHQSWSAAYEVRCRNWAGVTYDAPRAMIGGRRVVHGNPGKSPFHRINWFEKQVYLSIFHLSKENFSHYYKAIKENNVEYVVGYSSSIYLMARFLLELGYPKLKLKAVIGSSEKLTHSMKAIISSAFQCQVYDTWSGIEACALISEHSDGNLYISPDCGIIEFLDRDHNPVDYGSEGEMICTGLLNYDQPLIRYRIGDIGIPLAPLINQKIQMPRVKEIVGRTDDIITLRDGRKLSSFNRFFADLKGLKEVQVIQIDYDRFILNVVPDLDFDDSDKEALILSLRERLGRVHVEISFVDHIPRGKNGKFKAVISHIR